MASDVRRQLSQSMAIAGPPQTVGRVRLGEPHTGQTALVRASPYIGSERRSFIFAGINFRWVCSQEGCRGFAPCEKNKILQFSTIQSIKFHQEAS